jgi:hypothetical protein
MRFDAFRVTKFKCHIDRQCVMDMECYVDDQVFLRCIASRL